MQLPYASVRITVWFGLEGVWGGWAKQRAGCPSRFWGFFGANVRVRSEESCVSTGNPS